MRRVLLYGLAVVLFIAYLLCDWPNPTPKNPAGGATNTTVFIPTNTPRPLLKAVDSPRNDKRWTLPVDESVFKNIRSFIKKTGSYHKASNGYDSYYERLITTRGYEYTLTLQRRRSSNYLDTVDAVLVETHLLADTSIDGYHDYLIYEGEARSLLFDEQYEKKYFNTMIDSYAVIRTRAARF